MTTCARCGHELGIGRYCLNCGHPVGEPVPVDEQRVAVPDDAPLPDQAAAPSWRPWAIAAIVVVILSIVLASCLGGDDEPADLEGNNAQTAPPSAKTEPEKLPRAVDLTDTASVEAPPAAPATTDVDGQLVGYEATQLLDANPATAWRTAGDATGKTITLTLPSPTTIRRVGLINGYAKRVSNGAELVDWYPNNRRITAVDWIFDDGTTIRHVLSDVPDLQRLTIEPVTTSTVQLRLLSVTAPGAGPLGRDYTAISDVLIAGSPAV